MRKEKGGLLGCCAFIGLMIASSGVSAQSLAELEARVAQLEAEKEKKGLVVSGSGMDLTFYGYVRADIYADSKYNMGPNNLGFANITSESPEDGKFGAHAYQTRIGVKGSTGDFRFNFEGDFYGSGGGSFRIRHAYGEYAGWLLGQTWSNWNADGNPAAMVDFNGVPGGAGYRAMQIRYTHAISDALTASASIEDDYASYKSRPLLTGALRYTQGDTVYKLTVASRGLEDLAGDDVSGWGASLSAVAKPWEGGTVRGVYVIGEGVSSLLNYGNGIGQQAGQSTFKSGYDIDANGDPVRISGYGFDIAHAITPKLELSVSYGHYDYDDFAGMEALSVKDISTGFLTARYKPADNLLLAIEYQRLQRKEFGGAKVDNDRVNAMAQFSF